MYNGLILLFFAFAAAAAAWLLSGGTSRRRSMAMIDAAMETGPAGAVRVERPGPGKLTLWLHLAGYRRPSAEGLFLGAMAASTALALASVLLVQSSGLVELLSDSLGNIPGGIGDLARVIVSLTPWILFGILAPVPILAVRKERRRRVEQIEQDLPLFLELLATLAEAGLGFDTGLARIEDSESSVRPLYTEFRFYQRDVLAGVSRIHALRHLARRVEVNSVTVFVSALIQAEQVGAGLAETLRRQADDLRDRRKMQAVLQSQTLPVKLVFPLILCFLPGIFVSTLAPVLYQMIKVVDSLLRNVR
jgi:tight adherence protein C